MMTINRPVRAGFFATSGLVALLLVISSSGTSDNVVTADVNVRTDRLAEPIEAFDHLPLRALSSPDPVVRRRIHDGVQSVAARCMSDLGLVAPAMEFDATPTRARYGLVDIEVARDFGFRDPDEGAAEGDALAGLSPELIEAFVGDQAAGGHEVVVTSPEGTVLATYFRDGCLWQAEQVIYGDWAAYEGERIVLQRIDLEAHAAAARTPAVLAASDKWSSCMEAAGIEVRDGEDLHGRVLPAVREAAGGELGEAEVSLAIADVKCNLHSGLQAAWYLADVAAQEELLRRSSIDPQSFERMQSAAYDRATAALQ